MTAMMNIEPENMVFSPSSFDMGLEAIAASTGSAPDLQEIAGKGADVEIAARASMGLAAHGNLAPSNQEHNGAGQSSPQGIVGQSTETSLS